MRDRSDYDRRFGEHNHFMSKMETDLHTQGEYTQILGSIFSTLVENINMQMEAETADMIDRRMMQLYAVAHDKLDKGDVQNTTRNLGMANRNKGKTDLYGNNML